MTELEREEKRFEELQDILAKKLKIDPTNIEVNWVEINKKYEIWLYIGFPEHKTQSAALNQVNDFLGKALKGDVL